MFISAAVISGTEEEVTKETMFVCVVQWSTWMRLLMQSFGKF